MQSHFQLCHANPKHTNTHAASYFANKKGWKPKCQHYFEKSATPLKGVASKKNELKLLPGPPLCRRAFFALKRRQHIYLIKNLHSSGVTLVNKQPAM
jgi:hypothetical protein